METYVAPPGPYGKEGKIGRGWRLTRVAWNLIRRDRTMLTLALIGIGSVTFCTILIFALGGYFSQPHHANGGHFGLTQCRLRPPQNCLCPWGRTLADRAFHLKFDQAF